MLICPNLASYHHGFSEIRHGGTVAAIEETDRLASLPRVTSGNLLGGGKPTVFDGFLVHQDEMQFHGLPDITSNISGLPRVQGISDSKLGKPSLNAA